MSEYPWYEKVSDSGNILQGDIINSCPIYIPPAKSEIKKKKIKIKARLYTTIVMSQSCDLEYGRIKLVLVCPIHNLSLFGEKSTNFASDKGKENLRRGNNPGYHLLDECGIKDFEFELKVVDFRSVYGVPIETLFERIKEEKERIRLLPPYREHLSQAFARFFMRVGLPSNIPPFSDKV